MRTCATLGITRALTRYKNPKGNADTERLMRTVKEEWLGLREWTSALELERALAAWVDWDNTKVCAFGARVSDAVSGRTTTEPQDSARGRVTNGEHYMTMIFIKPNLLPITKAQVKSTAHRIPRCQMFVRRQTPAHPESVS